MPIRHQFHPAEKLLVSRHSGLVTDKDLVELYSSVFGENGFATGFNELVIFEKNAILDWSNVSFPLKTGPDFARVLAFVWKGFGWLGSVIRTKIY